MSLPLHTTYVQPAITSREISFSLFNLNTKHTYSLRINHLQKIDKKIYTYYKKIPSIVYFCSNCIIVNTFIYNFTKKKKLGHFHYQGLH